MSLLREEAEIEPAESEKDSEKAKATKKEENHSIQVFLFLLQVYRCAPRPAALRFPLSVSLLSHGMTAKVFTPDPRTTGSRKMRHKSGGDVISFSQFFLAFILVTNAAKEKEARKLRPSILNSVFHSLSKNALYAFQVS